MDLRGHGLSDKPREGYDDSKLWADDVNAVIQSLSLDHPVLCGWSYGSLVILDYIRHYTEEQIAASQFVGGITKLGSDEAMSVITPEFLSLAPGFFSNDLEEGVRSMTELLRLCFTEQPPAEELYLMLGFNLSVPPYVRQGLFSRLFDNDDLLPKLREACRPDQLSELSDKFRRSKKMAPTRPHPSAPDHPPANKILDAGAGLVDRLRDALTGRNA